MNKVQITSLLLCGMIAVFLSNCNIKSKQKYISEVDAVAVLQNNLKTQQTWVKVHAAEFLLWSGHPERVKESFLKENQLYGDSIPYRIGIWRVLAQAETEPQQKEVWINKIKTAFLDENGKDRLHAIETLAKLKVPVWDKEVKLSDILITDEMDNFAVYKLWNFACTSEENFAIAQDSLLKLSISRLQIPVVRAISGYALKKMGNLNHSSWNLLAESALSELSDIQVNLLNAAIVTANKEITPTDLYKQVKQTLIALNNREDKNSIKMNLLDALAEKGNEEDLDIIYSIFSKTKSLEDAESADVLSSCAYAILAK